MPLSSRRARSQVGAVKRRLVNPQSQRTLLTMRRVCSYGVRNFVRNAWLSIAATSVMVITLIIIFLTGIASSVLDETIEAQKNKMDISIYLKPEIAKSELDNLAEDLRHQPNVTSVSVSDSEAERDIFVNNKKANKVVMDALQTIAESGVKMDLPAVLHVKLQDYSKRDQLGRYIISSKSFGKWIDHSSMSSQDIETRQNTIKRLAEIMGYAGQVGLIMAVVFVVISVLIIFNTIRMTIFSRREEISMMRSIGADNYFIRGPFLVEANLYGIIAGILTVIAGYMLLLYILPGMGGYVEVGRTMQLFKQWWPVILLGMMAIGMMIGNVSARMAMRRYMK